MINKINSAITECFVGKDEVVKSLLTCLLAGGHVLLEDVPGVGRLHLRRRFQRLSEPTSAVFSLHRTLCRQT